MIVKTKWSTGGFYARTVRPSSYIYAKAEVGIRKNNFQYLTTAIPPYRDIYMKKFKATECYYIQRQVLTVHVSTFDWDVSKD